MSAPKKSLRMAVGIILALGAAIIFLAFPQGGDMLTVRSADGLIYALPMGESSFEIDFTHSVNKGGVREVYEFCGNGLGFRLVKGYFENFGAGMPDDGPSLSGFGEEDGWLTLIYDSDEQFSAGYFAGAEAGHTLIYGGQAYPISSLIPGRHFEISVGRISPGELLLMKLRYA